MFSPTPYCSVQINPNTVTQRYGRLAARLGIDTHLNCLRHYSATELITSGLDIRTVAGRLGHAPLLGPTQHFSLKQMGVYAASEAVVRGLGRTWAEELAPRGVHVNVITPGPIATPAIERLADRLGQSVRLPRSDGLRAAPTFARFSALLFSG